MNAVGRRAFRFALVVLLAVLAAVAVSLAANERADRLEPMDIFKLQYASDPEISPDGRRVAYVRQFADVMADERYSNLWIINADGSDHRPLTTGNHHDSEPRWSPDSTRLAYLSDAEGKPQIYVRWLDSGQTARITNLSEAPSALSWSPDGKLIAFSALVPGEPPHIAELPHAPSGAKWADPPRLFDRLIYRFNGVGYLKPGYQQLFVVQSVGGPARQVSSGDLPNGGTEFRPGSPAVWTPDGQYLIVSANRHPDWDYRPLDTEVYEFRVADGAVRALTDRRGPDDDPDISPDGRQIAYVGFDDKYQGYQVTELYLMNRDGSNPHAISAQLDRDAGRPRWAADGSGIYFQYDDQGDTKLGFYTLDGRLRQLAAHIGSAPSSYRSGSFTVARNNVFAFTYTLPDHPSDVAVGGPVEEPAKVITAIDSELLAAKHPGAVEEIHYTSAKDGRAIEGWIVKPPDFDPAKKYPLIIEIHGGPFANYGDRFDIEKQLYASDGYVVFYANPRGSTSYGEEFGNLIHHAYPGDDFYDLNSGVDAVLARGYVDPDNLFVTGGSGGGVLTCWMIDRTDRFRAAASLYPVINWYSWVLTSDLPAFGTLYWFPGPPWEHAEQYMNRSVLSLVGRVKTPTLLMTGEEDYRTPISEAEQYYEALKLRKIESVLVRVPGEPHGVSRRPSHQMAKVLYIEGWFHQHRTKPGAP